MATVKLEPQELSMLLQAISVILDQHRSTWQPIVDKLTRAQDQEDEPEPVVPEKEEKSRHRVSISPNRWTAEEDAIIRMHAEAGPSRWELMRQALPGRTQHMIKGRCARLGLYKLPLPEPPSSPEPAPTPEPTPTTTPPIPEHAHLQTKAGQSEPQADALAQLAHPDVKTDNEDWTWVGKPPPMSRLMGGKG